MSDMRKLLRENLVDRYLTDTKATFEAVASTFFHRHDNKWYVVAWTTVEHLQPVVLLETPDEQAAEVIVAALTDYYAKEVG